MRKWITAARNAKQKSRPITETGTKICVTTALIERIILMVPQNKEKVGTGKKMPKIITESPVEENVLDILKNLDYDIIRGNNYFKNRSNHSKNRSIYKYSHIPIIK